MKLGQDNFIETNFDIHGLTGFLDPKRGKIYARSSNILKTDNFSELLSKLNVLLLSITQHVDSTKKVDPEKLKDLGYELMFFF